MQPTLGLVYVRLKFTFNFVIMGEVMGSAMPKLLVGQSGGHGRPLAEELP